MTEEGQAVSAGREEAEGRAEGEREGDDEWDDQRTNSRRMMMMMMMRIGMRTRSYLKQEPTPRRVVGKM